MAARPSSPFAPRRDDLDHLRLLAIFHFIGAGLGALGLIFLFGHYAIVHSLLSHSDLWTTRHPPPVPPQLRLVLLGFYVLMGSWLAASGIGNLASGFLLRACRGRLFSMVVAAFNCLHVPLGTVLGVFTLVILSRKSVQRLYMAGRESDGTSPEAMTPPPAAIVVASTPPTLPRSQPAVAPQPDGDLTGGIIPYRNPRALAAYYLGVFGLIPVLGFILAVIAIPFGVAGLRAQAQNPTVRGRVHAWIGIVLGSLATSIQLLVVAMALLAAAGHGS